MAAIQTMKRSDTQKEPAALIFSKAAGSQNGRTDVPAVRRLFSFAVVRHFLYSSSSNLIRQSSRKCHHEASFTG